MSDTKHFESDKQRVLIFTAQTPRVSNKKIHFLFSQKQMEDILMDSAVRPVPFAPSYIEGLTEWRQEILPVISLEACLGMEYLNSTKTQRLMVIRAMRDEGDPMGIYRLMLRVVPPIRMVALPIECIPVSDDWIPESFFARGVFEWEDGLLVIADMKKIFTGIN
ncbi:MAG: chemotaxis protein CheW [Desulfobacterales bacterium]|jgi:chemotaxis signal transduction protein